MPYFKWRGVDLFGTMRSGKMFARSPQDIDNLLLNDRLISLVDVVEAHPWIFLHGNVSTRQKVDFFRQLSLLLNAGILLPEALDIVMHQFEDLSFQEVVHGIASDVQEGNSLSDGLKKYPTVFSNVVVQMAQVSVESGRTAFVLEVLSRYLETMHSFKRKLKSAAFLPFFTFIFFIVVAIVIFTFVVPRFQDVFASMNQELPYITSLVISVSTFVRSPAFFILMGAFLGLMFLACKLSNGNEIRRILDRFMLKVPLVGRLVIDSSWVCFLQSLSMLLSSGMHVVVALRIAQNVVSNSELHERVSQLVTEVEAGNSLSDAMAQDPDQSFGYDIIALVRVGQESGKLASMLEKASLLYQEKVDRLLTIFTTLFQPLLMIIMGMLITLLIFAVYLPVLQLGAVV